jgi:hypothetical protein
MKRFNALPKENIPSAHRWLMPCVCAGESKMPRIREHLIEEKTRHGKLCYLFHRRPDGRMATVKGSPGDPAFEARYSFLANGGDLTVELENASVERQRNHDSPQIAGELVRYHSSHLGGLVTRGEMSKYTTDHYQRFTRRFSDEYGEVSIHTIESHHLERLLEQWSATSNAWNNAFVWVCEGKMGYQTRPDCGIGKETNRDRWAFAVGS